MAQECLIMNPIGAFLLRQEIEGKYVSAPRGGRV